MIFEVFGTLFTFLVLLVNLPQACFFSAHLPKFNPVIPKLQELEENLQGFQSKTKQVNSVPNTSKIILPHGFKYDQNKTPSRLCMSKHYLAYYSMSICLKLQFLDFVFSSDGSGTRNLGFWFLEVVWRTEVRAS